MFTGRRDASSGSLVFRYSASGSEFYSTAYLITSGDKRDYIHVFFTGFTIGVARATVRLVTVGVWDEVSNRNGYSWDRSFMGYRPVWCYDAACSFLQIAGGCYLLEFRFVFPSVTCSVTQSGSSPSGIISIA